MTLHCQAQDLPYTSYPHIVSHYLQQTFIHSATIWDDSSELLPEKNSLTGFDRLEAKSKAFNSVNVKWICAGMLDLSTNKASFIQIQTTVEQPMKDFVSNRNGFPTVPASAWNFLAPAGDIPDKPFDFQLQCGIFVFFFSVM